MAEQTTSYSMFKKHSSNRPIDLGNLKKLTNSIKENNLLPDRPIVVDKDYQVIDGQHRLEAAKQLCIPIHYIVQEQSKAADILSLNAVQKPWAVEDYFHFHADQGKQDFQKVVRFCKKYNVRPTDVLQVTGNANAQQMQKWRKGEVSCKNIDQMLSDAGVKFEFINSVISFIDELVLTDKKYLKSKFLWRALAQLSSYEAFNHDMFFAKLKLSIMKMHSCSSVSEYLKMFISFYNYRNQDPLPLVEEKNYD